MSFGSFMSALGSGFSDVAGGLANLGTAWATIKGVNENKRINDLNFQLQQDNLEYQKGLQKIIFNREDNAVQRRVNDLRKAGLSPTLAAGSAAGAGSVISTSAPQRVSDLQGYLALAQVGTMIANQQKAQTDADIARQQLKQAKLDTKYLKDRGLAPIEVNQDWKARLLNLMYPKLEDALFGNDTKSGLFGAIIDSLQHDLTVRPPSGVTVNDDGKIVNPSGGSALSTYQVSLLKQKGLYREWLNAGLTDRVKKVLGIK
ncbi:minor capsid protein [Microvirus sp.]|nr:minor capsid protein [Microvirus sp.]